MTNQPQIKRIAVYEYEWELADTGFDSLRLNAVYQPGSRYCSRGYVCTVETSVGVVGECVGGYPPSYAQVGIVSKYLIGKNPLERELIYNDMKRILRKFDRMGMGPIDICLWDIAGKMYGVPICELLGGYRKSIPAYASTYHGEAKGVGGLDSPEGYANFALQCREMGYPAFKIHTWGNVPIKQEVANVLAVRKAVGPDMDLMLDGSCYYKTFSDALKVGRACDEAGFMWYEDPMQDGGISQALHRKLRQMIRTPLLIGEHVRSLEPHVDLILADATDYVRADAYYDCGVTGVMKIAHAAEGFGLDVELHFAAPVHRHLMAAMRNSNYYEMGLVHPKLKKTKPPIYTDYADDLDSVDENGHVPVPHGPGLGVQIDWDWVKKHQVGLTVYE